MLEAAHELRVERERKKELAIQKQNETAAAHQAQQRLTLLSQQLRELRQASLGATPEGNHFNTLYSTYLIVHYYYYAFKTHHWTTLIKLRRFFYSIFKKL